MVVQKIKKSMSKIKILIVDDRADNLVSIESILAPEGYDIVKATSGKDALKILLKSQDFNLILMDVKMPGLSGFETASMIYDRDKLRHIPIIFITAHSYSDEKTYEGYRTGAVDYIYKPINPQLLKAKVAVFVSIYKKNFELVEQGEKMKALNKQLEKQSQYVRSLIEASIDPLATINEDGVITDLNEALARITGVPRQKIAGTYFFDYFTDTGKAREIYQQVFRTGMVSDYPLTLRQKSGKLVDMLFNGSVYRDDLGNIQGVVIVAREKILSKYSRTLIEASLDPLITISSDGKITDMNEALASITGLERDEIKDTDFFEYFTDIRKARNVCQEVFIKGSIVNSPLVLKHKNGKLTDVLFNGSVYRDDRGIVQGAVIVARDVTAQKVFENELIEAKSNAEREKKIAEEAVKSKQQFLSNMSHEIRTPMNAIIGFTNVLLKTELSEKQKEYLNAIKISGKTLTVLINDILDLAKVDAGKMIFEQIPFQLSSSISGMLHLFETKIQEKKLKLLKEYDSRIPDTLVGDPIRLHQIILNLLGNAVKFTTEGKIVVGVKLLEQDAETVTLEFYVQDTGIGISESQLENIFDNFHQASDGTFRKYGGTGLGLAIARQLVEGQGGKIFVKSKEGKGSVFSFVLTFRQMHELEVFEQPVEEASDSEETLNVGTRKPSILVVEDVKLNQLLMQTLMTDFGFAMEMVENGKLAIEKLAGNHYDLVLMDLHMPEMNGFVATEYIRKEMKLNVPIIAITADVTTVDIERCLALGMNDHIAKPINEKILYGKIVRCINQSRAVKKNDVKKTSDVPNDPYKYINLKYLKRITTDDTATLKEILQTFLKETPRLIKTIKQCINNKDWDNLYKATHSLQPSFQTVGINQEYEEMARTIQQYAKRQENMEAIVELVIQIESICKLAFKELKQELNQAEYMKA
jgi:PAS domain S-box-containing protein